MARVGAGRDGGAGDYELVSIGDKLGLKGAAEPDSSAVFVDFLAPSLRYRVASSAKQQGLCRAVGIKGGVRPRILDATAGFGKDAFLLASQGCRVHMLERDERVYALLRDGLRRGLDSVDLDALESLRRLTLERRNFLDTPLLMPSSAESGGLQSERRDAGDYCAESWDVVTLDPMFPESKKSARVKKDMFALQGLLGAADDAEQMWATACRIAQKRVVVKRSKSAPALGDRAPDIQFKGSSSRFDVYLV